MEITQKAKRQQRHHEPVVNDLLNAEVELREAQRNMYHAKKAAIQFALEHDLDCVSLDVKKFKRMTHVGGA